MLMMKGSVPDCCIILGKPDDKENHVDHVPTLFAFTRPVDQAKAHMQVREQRSLRRRLREVNDSLHTHTFKKRISQTKVEVEQKKRSQTALEVVVYTVMKLRQVTRRTITEKL